MNGFRSPLNFRVSKAYLERCRLKTAGSLHVSNLSGTLSAGYLLFLASLQASKLEKAHLVLLSVFTGVIPLERTASFLLSTKDEKRSWIGGKLMVVSAASVGSVSVSEGAGGAELGGLFGCGVAVISLAPAGQSVHSQSPRQNRS